MKTSLRRSLEGTLGLVFGILPLHAQWVSQTIELRPGWNAVYLEVQPEPRDCDTVFAGLPVESAWAWNRRFSPVEFIQDPSTLVLPHPDWLVHVPSGHEARDQRNLFTVDAGRAYLIKLRDGSAPVSWVLKGIPRSRRPDWIAGSFNFVGFPVSPTSPPRFLDFFAPAPALMNMFRLGADGLWSRVDGAGSTAALRPGEAFWAFASTATDYAGPFRVFLEQRAALDYGRILQEQTLRVRNDSRVARSFTLSSLPSQTAPSGQEPVAGPVVLQYWDNNLSYTSGGWQPLGAPLASPSIAPGAEWSLRLAVRRSAMPRQGLCQSVLEVRDTPASLRALIPVTAEGLQGVSPRLASAGQGQRLHGVAGVQPHVRAGLWVGSAVLTNVSRPASIPANQLERTASDFQFRLLVHVDAEGKARLLQKVLQMWQDGTYKEVPHPINPQLTVRVVDEPGRFVLVADDRFIERFSGSAMRDGQPVARRYSTVAFAFPTPLEMAASGNFGEADGVFTCPVVLPYDDPRNPFVHRYHPDHDNLNERFEPMTAAAGPAGPETTESWTVTRNLRLRFTASDPQALGQPGWGDNQIGGLYEETIQGLHASDLKISGIFRLHRASDVPVLNDGLPTP